MSGKQRKVWLVIVRAVIVVLLAVLAGSIYYGLNPHKLRELLMLAYPIAGVVAMPDFGPTPLPPTISAQRGEPPTGPLAFWGQTPRGSVSCGFLMRLPEGRQLGVSAAHSTMALPADMPARFNFTDGALAVELTGQLRIGRPFVGEDFTSDYALWTIKGSAAEAQILTPDPRGYPVPGERIWLYNHVSSADGMGRWAGVVMQVKPEAIWVRFDEEFTPGGSSGCPVVSQHTGQVVGMVVAGENMPPVVIGLHPIASLLEKAQAALP